MQPNINHLPFKILLWANHRNLFTLGWLQGKKPKQIIDESTREKKISFKELLTCWKGRDLTGRNWDFVFPVKRKFMLRGGSGHFSEQNTWTKSIRDVSLHTSLWSTVWKSTANCAWKRARASLTTPDYEKPSVKSTDSDKSYLMPYLDWAAIVKFTLPSVLYPWALSPTVQALPPCQNLLFHLPAALLPAPRFPSKMSPSPPAPGAPVSPARAASRRVGLHSFWSTSGHSGPPPARCIPGRRGGRCGPRTFSWRGGREGGQHSGAEKPRAGSQLASVSAARRRAALFFLCCFLASGPRSGSRSPGARSVRSYPFLARFSWYDPTSLNGHAALSGQGNRGVGSGARGRCGPAAVGWSRTGPRAPPPPERQRRPPPPASLSGGAAGAWGAGGRTRLRKKSTRQKPGGGGWQRRRLRVPAPAAGRTPGAGGVGGCLCFCGGTRERGSRSFQNFQSRRRT